MPDDIIAKVEADWLRHAALQEIAGCKILSHNGTSLYTPDGEGNYRALWTRDFAYMVANAFDLIPVSDIKSCIETIANGQRSDGCVPDRVQVDGRAVYSAGPADQPLGNPPTDNNQFFVNLVYTYTKRSGDSSLLESLITKLHLAMQYPRRSHRGLIEIPIYEQRSPYGFTDTIAKKGELFFSTLLYWQACKEMIELLAFCNTDSEYYQCAANEIVSGIEVLWDAHQSAYLAATKQCAQVDIWGNAYAVYCGFLDDPQIPLGRKAAVLKFLNDKYDRYISRGQVRHLVEGEFWEKTLIPVTEGTYQNGAYWAAASGWIFYALMQVDRLKAIQLMQDLLYDFRNHGIYECVNGQYAKLQHYVVSAVNPLGAYRLFL